jgi:regulator of cell morphogenesis and NO signaling
MTDISQRTLGDLVTANPSRARILERHGLDYCCGGRRTLKEACAAAGLDEQAVQADLGASEVDPADWVELDPPALARHIADTHHRYLHEELPLLDALAEKVLTAHAIQTEVEPHLMREERVLFPAIDALARGQREFGFGSVANPIHMMGIEHDRAGQLLAELRAVTYGYEIPADACASYRSLYGRLAQLEADMHEHIHKENNVLFPAAMELAST